MSGYFNIGLGNIFGMNNWFMSDCSFPNYFNPFMQFKMPFFDFYNNWFNSFNFFNSNNYMYSANYYSHPSYLNFYDYWSDVGLDTFNKSENLYGYNAQKGKRLADIALKNSTDWTGYCARYVKGDIQEAGLGIYERGHAYQMADILRRNLNFREVSPDDVDVKDLPEGCVLVYAKGTQGYSDEYGHTEITVKNRNTGKINGVSDGITRNPKKPSNIFIPV